ncbi:hypothetical protein [Rhizobium leguminosarum]|uniref:hypothetical protein n=1 Tax=Rhizobium leguminosarum TaxID=384 RepID=UPI001CDC8787|nr:hypothetical protein [Rhizobium leguminosarum]
MQGLFAFGAHQILKNRRFLEEGRVLLAAGEGQDRRKVAAQHDRQFLAIRNQFDPFDKRAQHLCRPSARLLIAELIVKGGDLVVIVFGEVGMQKGRRLLRRLQHRRQFLFPLLQGHHLVIDAVGGSTLQDEVEKCVELAVDALDLG